MIIVSLGKSTHSSRGAIISSHDIKNNMGNSTRNLKTAKNSTRFSFGYEASKCIHIGPDSIKGFWPGFFFSVEIESNVNHSLTRVETERLCRPVNHHYFFNAGFRPSTHTCTQNHTDLLICSCLDTVKTEEA